MRYTFFLSYILLVCLSFNGKAQQTITDSAAFHKAVEKVKGYNLQIAELNTQVRQNAADDQMRAKLNLMLTECFQVPIDFIAVHPGSFYAISALRMLGQGDPNTLAPKNKLLQLFGSLSDNVKNSDEGAAYLINLKSWGKAVIKDEAKIAASSEQYDKQGYLNHFAFKEKLKVISKQQGKNMLTVARATIEIDSLLNVVGTNVRKNIQTKKFSKSKSKKKLSGLEIYTKVKFATLIACLVNPSNTEQFMKATAYVINEAGVCVTNYHVLAAFMDGALSNFFMSNSEGEYFPVIKVLAISPVDDLAVLQIDTKGTKLPVLTLGDSVQEGTDVYAMGHADDFFYYFTKGMVAGNYTFTDNGYKHSKVLAHPIMTITADYSVGSSGGPVVDEYGNVVGTISQTNTIYADKAKKIDPQMVMKKTIPVLVLKKILGW